MGAEGSVTYWIRQLQEGDAAAAQQLWERYFHRMVGLARKRLRGSPRREADEEDVALSAFDSFCRGVVEGRFPQLTDRTDLWQILVLITARKALDLLAHQRRLKRGGGANMDTPDGDESLEQIVGREPTPEFAAQVAEQCQRLLDGLPDEGLRQIAVWKMESFTNDEIAAKLGCAAVTVARRLRVIRSIWEEQEGRAAE